MGHNVGGKHQLDIQKAKNICANYKYGYAFL